MSSEPDIEQIIRQVVNNLARRGMIIVTAKNEQEVLAMGDGVSKRVNLTILDPDCLVTELKDHMADMDEVRRLLQ